MSDNSSYLDLAQRIAEAFPEIDSDIIADFADSDEDYAKLHGKISAMKQAHPFIDKVLEDEGELTLTAEEHKVLTEYFKLQFRLENMERQQLYFRGHTDCIAYLKKVGAL